jgi:hypothetical protein
MNGRSHVESWASRVIKRPQLCLLQQGSRKREGKARRAITPPPRQVFLLSGSGVGGLEAWASCWLGLVQNPVLQR